MDRWLELGDALHNAAWRTLERFTSMCAKRRANTGAVQPDGARRIARWKQVSASAIRTHVNVKWNGVSDSSVHTKIRVSFSGRQH